MKTHIPKYIENILYRSNFYFSGKCEPGYTILIRKKSAYTTARVFHREIERLASWVRRQMPEDYNLDSCPPCIIHYVPDITKHDWQYAKVTIYDPIMKFIEHLIKSK